jgi:DNA-binding NarL/FixJ family response regulator
VPTIRQTLTTNWGPYLESAARQVTAVLVAVYVAGYCLGSFVHRLNAALSAWASRPHRPANPSPALVSADPVAIPGPVSIKASALLQAGGLSQREIARILQVSRSTVRRQLQTT